MSYITLTSGSNFWWLNHVDVIDLSETALICTASKSDATTGTLWGTWTVHNCLPGWVWSIRQASEMINQGTVMPIELNDEWWWTFYLTSGFRQILLNMEEMQYFKVLVVLLKIIISIDYKLNICYTTTISQFRNDFQTKYTTVLSLGQLLTFHTVEHFTFAFCLKLYNVWCFNLSQSSRIN